ncbi:MAG: hypothetical protein R2857_11805 [Vampirovibrionales bacterium]
MGQLRGNVNVDAHQLVVFRCIYWVQRVVEQSHAALAGLLAGNITQWRTP